MNVYFIFVYELLNLYLDFMCNHNNKNEFYWRKIHFEEDDGARLQKWTWKSHLLRFWSHSFFIHILLSLSIFVSTIKYLKKKIGCGRFPLLHLLCPFERTSGEGGIKSWIFDIFKPKKKGLLVGIIYCFINRGWFFANLLSGF